MQPKQLVIDHLVSVREVLKGFDKPTYVGGSQTRAGNQHYSRMVLPAQDPAAVQIDEAADVKSDNCPPVRCGGFQNRLIGLSP